CRGQSVYTTAAAWRYAGNSKPPESQTIRSNLQFLEEAIARPPLSAILTEEVGPYSARRTGHAPGTAPADLPSASAPPPSIGVQCWEEKFRRAERKTT